MHYGIGTEGKKTQKREKYIWELVSFQENLQTFAQKHRQIRIEHF